MINAARRNQRPPDPALKWCVYGELTDGTDVVIEWLHDEIQAGDLCGQLCDAWEQEHMPSDAMSDEDRERWREDHDWAPFYISEIDEYFAGRLSPTSATELHSASPS